VRQVFEIIHKETFAENVSQIPVLDYIVIIEPNVLNL